MVSVKCDLVAEHGDVTTLFWIMWDCASMTPHVHVMLLCYNYATLCGLFLLHMTPGARLSSVVKFVVCSSSKTLITTVLIVAALELRLGLKKKHTMHSSAFFLPPPPPPTCIYSPKLL